MTRGEAVKYSCVNDCKQTGCPGHIMQVDYHRTADVIIASIDGKPWMYLDDAQWDAMHKSMEKWNE